LNASKQHTVGYSQSQQAFKVFSFDLHTGRSRFLHWSIALSTIACSKSAHSAHTYRCHGNGQVVFDSIKPVTCNCRRTDEMQLSLSNITDIHLCFFDEALPECSRGPFFDSRCSFAAYSNTRLVESKVRPIIFVYIYICMLIFVYMYLYASVMCTCVCMCVCVCVLLLPCIYW